MPVEAADIAGRLRELAVEFAVAAPQAVAELSDLAGWAERASVNQRRQILQRVELLAHRLNGRAAVYECPALSARAAALEVVARRMLAGASLEKGKLPELCRLLAAALPGSDTILRNRLDAP